MKLSKEFIAMFREEAKKAQWEINRWNGKSIDDLVVDYLERKELKPEDFTGAVILTVEEAKEIAVTMFVYHELCQKFLIGDDNFVIKASKVSHNLDKKIEQAEKQ